MSSDSRENKPGQYGVLGGEDNEVPDEQRAQFHPDIAIRKDIPDKLPLTPKEHSGN
jgi:hypothetical protein